MNGIPSFIEALQKIRPDAKFKVMVFELNADQHNIGRALSNARAINELQRIGDRVPIVCSANGLQPDGQNDNGWNQGLLFLNPSQVWSQPPLCVAQMLSRNWLPNRVESDAQSPGKSLDVTALAAGDGKKLQLQVVNLDGKPLRTAIELQGFTPTGETAEVSTLSGLLEDTNTSQNPQKITPKQSQWRHHLKDGKAVYNFPPHSFTILRFE